MFGLISRQKEWDESKPVNFFFFNVFNSLLTHYTRSIRRHLGIGGGGVPKNKSFDFYIWFFLKTIKYYKICPAYAFLLNSFGQRNQLVSVAFWLQHSKQNYLWLTQNSLRSESYRSSRCLLIRHSPNSLKTVARAAQYSNNNKLMYLVFMPHSYDQPILVTKYKS